MTGIIKDAAWTRASAEEADVVASLSFLEMSMWISMSDPAVGSGDEVGSEATHWTSYISLGAGAGATTLIFGDKAARPGLASRGRVLLLGTLG